MAKYSKFARAFAKSAAARHSIMGQHLRKEQIRHADIVDKEHGLKPTSFLVDMLAKTPRHEAELIKLIEERLSSDARPKHRKHAKKKGSKTKHKHAHRGPGRPKGSKTKHHAKKRGPGRPKGSKNKPKHAATIATHEERKHKHGPGRPKGSKTKHKHAKHAKKRGPGRPKGSKTKHKRSPAQKAWAKKLGAMSRARAEKKYIKEAKKRHKKAHKSAWRATTPGFAGVKIE